MPQPDNKRGTITFVFIIVLGLAIGTFIKRVPLGLVIGLALGLLASSTFRRR